MRSMRLTSYGWRELALSTLAAGILSVTAYLVLWPLMLVPLAGWLSIVWFFRDPERISPRGGNVFVSPADGRVTDITPVGPDSSLGQAGIRIGIFMSVLNVHVNRSPCDGIVIGIIHRPGAFLDARDPMAGERNESATIALAVQAGGQDYPVVMRQIAGLIARRIVTDLRGKQSVVCGQRIGMIKFGSRVEVLVPNQLVAEIKVSIGQKVYAGATVLATCPYQITT